MPVTVLLIYLMGLMSALNINVLTNQVSVFLSSPCSSLRCCLSFFSLFFMSAFPILSSFLSSSLSRKLLTILGSALSPHVLHSPRYVVQLFPPVHLILSDTWSSSFRPCTSFSPIRSPALSICALHSPRYVVQLFPPVHLILPDTWFRSFRPSTSFSPIRGSALSARVPHSPRYVVQLILSDT